MPAYKIQFWLLSLELRHAHYPQPSTSHYCVPYPFPSESFLSCKLGFYYSQSCHILSPFCVFAITMPLPLIRASLVAQTVKCLPTMQETQVRSLGQGDPLETEMATHSSILAWKVPWSGRLQSMGSQRVGQDWATSLHFTFNTSFDFYADFDYLTRLPRVSTSLQAVLVSP